VCFPNGTIVIASPLAARREDPDARDFGLYMDPAWDPSWDHDLIDWPDFGLPVNPEETAARIISAFERAKAGEQVEVGCVGGLGRTGTVLACMAILSGTPADDAVSWVRANYDHGAVETAEQEAWVLWFGRHITSAVPRED
jgi:protein-tyrosine phosphatase